MTAASTGTQLDATALIAAYRARELSPVEVLAADLVPALASAGRALDAIATDCFARAHTELARAERAYKRGARPRPLEGVPYVAKDLFDREAVATGYGSSMFGSHVPAADAEMGPVSCRLPWAATSAGRFACPPPFCGAVGRWGGGAPVKSPLCTTSRRLVACPGDQMTGAGIGSPSSPYRDRFRSAGTVRA